MIVTRIIQDIESYLMMNPLKNAEKASLLNNNIQKNALSNVSLPQNAFMGATSNNMEGNSDLALIEGIIKYCNDDQLEEMLHEYGDESYLGQIICRRRAERYVKLRCTTETIAMEIEKDINAIKYENPLYRSICVYMERIGFITDAEFYNSIGMPRQLFAKLRDGRNTLSKKTVLWIVVGLKLNYHQANDLLHKAGYSFRKGDLRDVILTYIFRNTDYDLWGVNEILDYFGLEPVC